MCGEVCVMTRGRLQETELVQTKDRDIALFQQQLKEKASNELLTLYNILFTVKPR